MKNVRIFLLQKIVSTLLYGKPFLQSLCSLTCAGEDPTCEGIPQRLTHSSPHRLLQLLLQP